MKKTIFLVLSLLLIGVPAILSSQTVSDRPPVTSPAPRVELATFETKVAEMTKVLPAYSARFTCKLEVFDERESEITEDGARIEYAKSYDANVEMSVCGDRYHSKFFTASEVVEELNDGITLTTLTIKEKRKPRMTVFHDRSRPADPVFMTPLEELKAALMPGLNITDGIRFTHHERGLDVKKYPCSEAYIGISPNGWVAVFVDSNGLPVQTWWGDNHSLGYSFSSYSDWKKDDKGRQYPAHLVEKYWYEGKWVSRVTIDITVLNQTFDQKKVFEEKIKSPEGIKIITQ